MKLYSLFKDNVVPVNEDALETLYECLMNMVKPTNQVKNGYRKGKQATVELASTAIIARMFDRYLFPDCKLGACLHQMPTRKLERDVEQSDMYCITLKDYSPDYSLATGRRMVRI